MRHEVGLRGKSRPLRLDNMQMREASEICEELPQNSRIHGNADRFAIGLARQPGDGGLIESPSRVLLYIAGKESVELPQRKLRASISESQTSLELQEAVQFTGHRAVKDLVHRGTGKPTPRRRLIATRT